MAVIKILRNVSGSSRNVLNRQLGNGESYEIPYSQWSKAADSEILANDINAGFVIVNNGTSDITNPVDAIAHLKTWQDNLAEVTPRLREATRVTNGSVVINSESAQLFESDSVDTISFLKEEIR